MGGPPHDHSVLVVVDRGNAPLVSPDVRCASSDSQGELKFSVFIMTIMKHGHYFNLKHSYKMQLNESYYWVIHPCILTAGWITEGGGGRSPSFNSNIFQLILGNQKGYVTPPLCSASS